MPGAPYCGLSRKSKPSLRQSVWWICDSAPRPLSTTRARTAGVASSRSQPVCVYGGLSDGTLPSTLPITKNGAPRTDSSSSYQCTGGSGTSVCSDNALMTLYCESKSASRKIVCEVGFTRITKPADRASPPSFHEASNSSVSFEKPGERGADERRDRQVAGVGELAREPVADDAAGFVQIALLGNGHDRVP